MHNIETKNKRACVIKVLFLLITLGMSIGYDQSAYAGGNPNAPHCIGCEKIRCELASEELEEDHNGPRGLSPATHGYEAKILENWKDAFGCYRSWLVDHDNKACNKRDKANANQNNRLPKYFKETILPAFMGLTEQMSAVAMHQAFMIGQFFDAKHQLETQRILQERQFQAVKDYTPSRDICLVGSAAKNMANTERNLHDKKQIISKVQLGRLLGEYPRTGSENADYDKKSRWESFKKLYCDPNDNGGKGKPETGLKYVCKKKGERPNRDINYTELVDFPRTLDFEGKKENPSDDEKDIMALANNLYGHDVLSRQLTKNILNKSDAQHQYLLLRSTAAKHMLAQNSFNAIVAMKAKGTGSAMIGNKSLHSIIYEQQGLPKVLQELKQTNTSKLENNPSYFTMLETLSSQAYKNTKFFSDLYDKPANVKRKSVALKAVDLMLDRTMFESELRQEMLLSVLLSSRQNDTLKEIDVLLGNKIQKPIGER